MSVRQLTDDEFLRECHGRDLIIINPSDLRQINVCKTKETNNGFVKQIAPLHLMNKDYLDFCGDMFKEAAKTIRERETGWAKKYNELIDQDVKVKKTMSECETGEEFQLYEIVRFLRIQNKHLKDQLLASEKIREETDDDKLRRLKHEVNYYSSGFKPKSKKDIIKDEDYYKWCEIIKLRDKKNRVNAKAKKTNVSTPQQNLIVTPNVLEIVGSENRTLNFVNNSIVTPNYVMEVIGHENRVPNFVNNSIVTPNYLMEIVGHENRVPIFNGFNPVESMENATFNNVVPKENPTFNNVVPKENATFNNVVPKENATFNNVVPKENATFNNVVPKENPTFNNVVPKENATFNNVVPKENATFNNVVPKENTLSNEIITPNFIMVIESRENAIFHGNNSTTNTLSKENAITASNPINTTPRENAISDQKSFCTKSNQHITERKCNFTRKQHDSNKFNQYITERKYNFNQYITERKYNFRQE